MDELIGRAFDRANLDQSAHDDSPFDPLIESFLISLIKNRPFPMDVRLRSDSRKEITVHTAPDEITRQRIEWAKSRKDYGSWIEVHRTLSRSTRRLPLPPHYSLSLDIASNVGQIRPHKSPAKAARWSIFLASAVTEKGNLPLTSKKEEHSLSRLAETPAQLVDIINEWRRLVHQSELSPEEITSRVADEMFNRQDAAEETADTNFELLLECLAQNAPFIYPIDVYTQESPPAEYSDSYKIGSTNEVLPLPTRYTAGIIVSIFPSDMKEEEPLMEVWKTVVVSYAFPPKATKARATRNKVGQ